MEAQTDPLIHFHVLLGNEQKRRLRLWAADRDTSMAELVREAIDQYLRVAVGPSPAKVRRAARDAVGCLPQEHSSATDSSRGSGARWWANEPPGEV